MAYQPGRNPFNPLLVGAIAVIAALVAFLVFRDGTDMTQQAGIQSPPTSTTPAPPAKVAPTPDDPPKGSGNL
jgi:hypothetical protein